MFSHSPAKHAACSNQTMTDRWLTHIRIAHFHGDSKFSDELELVRNRFTGYRFLVIHLGGRLYTRIAKLVMHRTTVTIPVTSIFSEFRQTEPIGIILVMCWSDIDLRL